MVAWEGCGARQYRAGAGKDGPRRANTGSGLAAAARPYSGVAGTKTKGKEAERKRRTWEGLPGARFRWNKARRGSTLGVELWEEH